ncbi:MAG: exonuclease SbcCD subunit D [Oscillospiraceae bacterium]|nr:exonuclease SbcCD subunit D [Oscillospiraceae bacterium]
MRLLHTSDWHLGKSLFAFSLLEDQEYFLRELLGLLKAERVDALLIAGDIYDRPVPPAGAVRLFDWFLREAVAGLGVRVLAVAGNHDSGERLEFASTLLGGAGYHIAGKLGQEIPPVVLADEHGPVQIHLLPWIFPADARMALPGCQAKSFDEGYKAVLGHMLPGLHLSARNIIVAHGFFAGAGGQVLTSESEVSVGGMDLTDSRVFSSFSYAALGHLHAPQTAGCAHIRYSGSPIKYSLSEEIQRKSATLIELGKPSEVAVREIPLPALRDLRTVSGSFDDLMNPAWHANQNFGDYVFAEITDPGALYPMEKLRTLFPRLLGLRFPLTGGEDGAVHRIGGRRENLSPVEQFSRFYRAVKGEDIPDRHLRLLEEVAAHSPEDEVAP